MPVAAIHRAYLVASLMVDALSQDIRQVGDPIARALGIEIIDVQCIGRAASPLVRLTLDKDGGIGIDDCEQFHQSLRRAWEITQPTGPTCRFEVSSPGLDRPLKDRKDFQRVINKRLCVTVQNDEGKPEVVIGRLMALNDSGLQLVDDRSKAVQGSCVAWRAIVKATVEVEFS